MAHETENASVWLDIESSAASFDSWPDAFEAGTVTLFKLVADERTGPRAQGEDAAPLG